MNNEIFHNQAMELADEAALLLLKGKEQEALSLFQKATELETQAANSLPLALSSEPSRSILFRSAAALAVDAKEYKLADRLVANGLAGFPPPEIERELKDLYEDINFMRHADAQGIEIASDGLIMTVAGQATFYGGVLAEHIVSRLDRLQKEFYRTVERLLGLSFRTEKPVDAKIREQYTLYLNTHFGGSFGVYLQVGAPKKQPPLFKEFEPVQSITGEEIIKEVVDCLRILEGSNPEQLRSKIPDEIYFDDFVSFARQIAPDGKEITTVVLRTSENTNKKPLVLRKDRKQLRDSLPRLKKEDVDNESIPSELRGTLKRASSPKFGKYGTVGLELVGGGRVSVKVPLGYMKDTVQPYYEEPVVVTVYEREGKYYLDDIDKFQENLGDV